jgi:hypothetical protein
LLTPVRLPKLLKAVSIWPIRGMSYYLARHAPVLTFLKIMKTEGISLRKQSGTCKNAVNVGNVGECGNVGIEFAN